MMDMKAVEFYAKVKNGKITVPKRYLDKIDTYVRVFVLSENLEAEEWTDEDEQALDEVGGILSEYANPDLIPLEKEAWKIAVMKKYARGTYDAG